jgi:hypothetical protein
MSFESMSAILGDVSRLLVRVENASDERERTSAMRQLWAIRSTLEQDLKSAEVPGDDHRLEVTALRSALKTLTLEMALAGADEPGLLPPAPAAPLNDLAPELDGRADPHEELLERALTPELLSRLRRAVADSREMLDDLREACKQTNEILQRMASRRRTVKLPGAGS